MLDWIKISVAVTNPNYCVSAFSSPSWSISPPPSHCEIYTILYVTYTEWQNNRTYSTLATGTRKKWMLEKCTLQNAYVNNVQGPY